MVTDTHLNIQRRSNSTNDLKHGQFQDQSTEWPAGIEVTVSLLKVFTTEEQPHVHPPIEAQFNSKLDCY